MAKVFNVTGPCIPEEHYMVNIESRLQQIRQMIDAGKYFSINRARQYGKTTTLMALEQYLKNDYYVVSLDFQTFGNADFKDENTFSLAFAGSFLRRLRQNKPVQNEEFRTAMSELKDIVLQRKD